MSPPFQPLRRSDVRVHLEQALDPVLGSFLGEVFGEVVEAFLLSFGDGGVVFWWECLWRWCCWCCWCEDGGFVFDGWWEAGEGGLTTGLRTGVMVGAWWLWWWWCVERLLGLRLEGVVLFIGQ